MRLDSLLVLARRGQLARFYPVFLLGLVLLVAAFSPSLFAQDKTAYLSLKDWGVQTGEHPSIEFTLCNPTQTDYASLDFTEEKLVGPGLTGLNFYLWGPYTVNSTGWALEEFYEPVNATYLNRSVLVPVSTDTEGYLSYTLAEVRHLMTSTKTCRALKVEGAGWQPCTPTPGSTACLQRVDVIPTVAGFSFPEYVVWEHVMDSWNGTATNITADAGQPLTLTEGRVETPVDAFATMDGLYHANQEDPANNTRLVDATSTGLDGTGQGSFNPTIKFVSGNAWVNKSLDYDRTNDPYVHFPQGVLVDDGTVCVGFYFPAVISANEAHLWSTGLGDLDEARDMWIPTDTQYINFFTTGGGGNCGAKNIAQTSDLALGEWHQVCWVVNSSSRHVFYLDGAWNGTDNTCTGSFSATPTGGAMRLGAHMSTAAGRSFNGTMDELILYDVGLNASQIQALWDDFQPRKASAGIFQSDAFCDTCNGSTVNWTNVYYNATLPAGTDLTIDLSFSEDNVTWSNDMLNVTSGDPINETSRYVRWTATLLPNPERTASPSLSNVTIAFEYPEAQNYTITFNLTSALTGEQIFTNGVNCEGNKCSFDMQCSNGYAPNDVQDNPHAVTHVFDQLSTYQCNVTDLFGKIGPSGTPVKFQTGATTFEASGDIVVSVPMETEPTPNPSPWSQSANVVYNNSASVLVGIGTNSPTDTLNVAGTFNASAAGGTGVYIDSANNVGIGTSSPARSAHIRDVLRLEPRSSAPSSPALGDVYVDSDTNEFCFYDGASWIGLKASGACA